MTKIQTYEQTVDWLFRFGYLDDQQPSAFTHDIAVGAMQRTYGLVNDGIAGPLTRHAMGCYRCGCTDRKALRVDEKHCKWQKREITYALQKRLTLKNNGQSETARLIRAGFTVYEPLTGLEFTEITDWKSADIRIGKGAGWRYGFDGPGNVLAWAEMPCMDDDVFLYSFFDAAEPWNLQREGYGILASAVWQHELGHLLGLDHSEDAVDLMAPIYNPQIIGPQEGDKIRLATVYGVDQTPRLAPGIPVGTHHVSGMMTVEEDSRLAFRLEVEQ